MVGIIRYVQNIRRSGIRQWWRNMQYTGDPKYGALKGTGHSATSFLSAAPRPAHDALRKQHPSSYDFP